VPQPAAPLQPLKSPGSMPDIGAMSGRVRRRRRPPPPPTPTRAQIGQARCLDLGDAAAAGLRADHCRSGPLSCRQPARPGRRQSAVDGQGDGRAPRWRA
jgi:hypothetical protein